MKEEEEDEEECVCDLGWVKAGGGRLVRVRGF